MAVKAGIGLMAMLAGGAWAGEVCSRASVDVRASAAGEVCVALARHAALHTTGRGLDCVIKRR